VNCGYDIKFTFGENGNPGAIIGFGKTGVLRQVYSPGIKIVKLNIYVQYLRGHSNESDWLLFYQ